MFEEFTIGFVIFINQLKLGKEITFKKENNRTIIYDPKFFEQKEMI